MSQSPCWDLPFRATFASDHHCGRRGGQMAQGLGKLPPVAGGGRSQGWVLSACSERCGVCASWLVSGSQIASIMGGGGCYL